MRQHTEVFEEIYDKERWGKGKGSGTGSAPDYCAGWLEYLTDRIPEGSNVLDLGCGDHQLYEGFNLSRWNYHGVDVSTTALELARKRGYTQNLTHLSAQDVGGVLCKCELEDIQFLLIKDVLMHWTDEEIRAVLDPLCATYKGVIITANNFKYRRLPNKSVMPRELDRYSWAPVPIEHPVLQENNFKVKGYYPRGKIKVIMEREQVG